MLANSFHFTKRAIFVKLPLRPPARALPLGTQRQGQEWVEVQGETIVLARDPSPCAYPLRRIGAIRVKNTLPLPLSIRNHGGDQFKRSRRRGLT
jgi:hypothetical protein